MKTIRFYVLLWLLVTGVSAGSGCISTSHGTATILDVFVPMSESERDLAPK